MPSRSVKETSSSSVRVFIVMMGRTPSRSSCLMSDVSTAAELERSKRKTTMRVSGVTSGGARSLEMLTMRGKSRPSSSMSEDLPSAPAPVSTKNLLPHSVPPSRAEPIMPRTISRMYRSGVDSRSL
eukprot:5768634-Pleurochrysis_carterae.AAC.1